MPADYVPNYATKLTGKLPAAVGVIAVSGPTACSAILNCWKSASGKSELALNRIYYGQWIGPPTHLHENAEDVVLCRVDADIVEIHCHGGSAVLNRILDDLSQSSGVKLGSRPLRHIQDRIALYAWGDLKTARTANAVHLLLTQANGKLSSEIRQLIANVAASAEQKAHACDELIRRSRVGLLISQPPEVVILGPPNAGKSTLINRLLGWERAIVDATPGTTRDVLREEISLAGWPLTILDTAGLRQSSDDIEIEGIARALKLADQVACILLMIDGTTGWTDKHQDVYEQFEGKTIVVLNKSDLVKDSSQTEGQTLPHDVIAISALRGDSIEDLVNRLIMKLGYDVTILDEAVPFRQAQVETIQAARELAQNHAAFANCLETLLFKADD